MREIKFRAWDKENKKFYDDIFGIDDSGQVILIEQGTVLTTPKYVVAKNCIPLQYTGLKDKNGKEIYEGDIVHGVRYCDDRLIETTGKVIWSYCELMIENERGTYDPFLNYYNDFYSDELSEIEVIGNIYENEEMMKEGKE